MSAMTFVKRPQAGDALGGHSGHGDGAWGAAVAQAAKPVVSAEIVSRFHALIDEVTDELMQGKEADRHICRADAIALLIATSEQAGGVPEGVESPLRYLLLEEQQKAVAALGRAGNPGQAFTFLKLC
jgi:hypothetical protein